MTAPAARWLPYCGSAPEPADLLARWNLDPVLLALAFAAGAAWLWLRPRDRVRDTCAAAALLTFLLLFVSPFCALGSALFTARAAHHIVLATVLAPLLGGMLGLARRAPPGSLMTWTGVQALVFWAWHAPPLYAAALASDALFWLMQATITGSAAIFWAKLRQAPAAGAVAALLATMVQMGALGALITFAGRPLYPPHWLTTRSWGLSPLEDQQIAGLVMWAPGSAVYLLAALTLLYRSLDSGTARPVALR